MIKMIGRGKVQNFLLFSSCFTFSQFFLPFSTVTVDTYFLVITTIS